MEPMHMPCPHGAQALEQNICAKQRLFKALRLDESENAEVRIAKPSAVRMICELCPAQGCAGRPAPTREAVALSLARIVQTATCDENGEEGRCQCGGEARHKPLVKAMINWTLAPLETLEIIRRSVGRDELRWHVESAAVDILVLDQRLHIYRAYNPTYSNAADEQSSFFAFAVKAIYRLALRRMRPMLRIASKVKPVKHLEYLPEPSPSVEPEALLNLRGLRLLSAQKRLLALCIEQLTGRGRRAFEPLSALLSGDRDLVTTLDRMRRPTFYKVNMGKLGIRAKCENAARFRKWLNAALASAVAQIPQSAKDDLIRLCDDLVLYANSIEETGADRPKYVAQLFFVFEPEEVLTLLRPQEGI